MIKKLSLTLFILLIVLALIIVAIPKAIQFGAIYFLNEQGIEAEIKDINIDILNGKFEIIDAHGENNEGNGFNIGHLLIGFQWSSLLDNMLVINNIKLDEVKLDTVHTKQAIKSIGGINLIENNKQDVNPQEQAINAEKSTSWKISINDISLNNINVCNTFENESKKICSKIKSFNWVGKIDFATDTPIEKNINIASSLVIRDISITDTINNIPILTNSSIDLINFKMSGVDKLSFESFIVQGLEVFPETESTKSIALLDSLKVSQLDLTNNQQLNINNIIITGIGTDIVIDKNKSLNIQQRLSNSLPNQNEKTPQEDEKSTKETEKTNKKSLAIKIDSIRIENSHPLSFNDQSLNTPFNISSIINLLSITDIDTTKPTTNNHLTLNVTTGNHGILALEGDIQALSEKKEFNISGTAKGIDLRPINSYLEAPIGHKIKSGQLNADITLTANKGTIDSLLNLNLKKFKLRPVSDKEKGKLNKELGLGMPLDTALNLLRDSDDNISIKLPITGDVENPDFDPSDAIYTAMSKAITATIINYYTPFGLVTVAGGLFDLATALHFEPVIFDANESTILASHEPGLNKVIQLMKQRPQLNLTLCGFSNIKDLSKVAPDLYAKTKDKPENKNLNDEVLQKLTATASNRSDNVKTYFVKNKIAADRLILCEPEYKNNAVAGVELSL